MPRGNHALSIASASNGGQREDTKLLQHLQLCQHGQFWHVSVSERQRLRLCGTSEPLWGLRKTVLATNVEESDRAMAANSTTKVLISPPPG